MGRWAFIAVLLGFGCGSDTGAAAFPDVPPDPVVMARAAAFVGSCLDDPIHELVARGYLSEADDFGVRRGGACLADATDGCAAVSRCTTVAFDVDPNCVPGCHNDVFTACGGDGKALTIRCPNGWSCAPDGETCRVDGAEPCDYDTFVPRCDDGRPVTCGGDVSRIGARCAHAGLTCAADADGARCIGEGEACDGAHGDWFEGTWMRGTCVDDDILRTCANGRVHLQTCGALAPGFRCQTAAGGDFCGLGGECPPYDYEDAPTCEGTVLSVCNAGKIEAIDCTTLGFTRCESRGPDGYICAPGPFGD